MAPRFRLLFLAPVLALTSLAARPAISWGTPHTEITRWGLLNVPAEDRLDERIGRRRMEDLAWGGDYQHDVMPDYYIDDYLLFPSFPRHSSHMLPDVAQAWKPFFRRTLQALRTESPTNAARWLGSFLHFVEDSGSPPHALPTGGVLHTRMENYVLALDIRLNDYRPKLLGTTDDEAAVGIERRMRELVAYSRERAEKMLPAAHRDDRAACEPLVLECAIECARVVADVTHTALVLTNDSETEGATLEGEVTSYADPFFPHPSARILVEGTDLATVAEAAPSLPGEREYRGRFVIGGLPPGKRTVWIYRTGCKTEVRTIRLEEGERTSLRLRLKADPQRFNVVRNADFAVRWLRRDTPDHWTFTPDGWRSDTIKLPQWQRYTAGATDGSGAREVTVLTGTEPRMGNTRPARVGAKDVIQADQPYARLLVKGATEPQNAWLRPVLRLRD